MNLINELNIAKSASIRAGLKIMDIYKSTDPLQVIKKDDDSPLTIADRTSNDIIVSCLEENFPKYAILSEESKDNLNRLKNDFCWIVDPLDGTKEFIKQNGEFTVNIALSYKNKVVLGVIYVPVTGELYLASHGNGAFYEKGEHIQKIKVSDRTKGIRVVMSRSHASEKMDRLIQKYNITDVKSAGSSIKGCLIAKGEAEVYYRFNGTMEWDTAAMQCIVQEAGAVFKQMDNSEMLYNREDSLNKKGFYIINRIENQMQL